MPPQNIITNVQRNITPQFTYVNNQIAVQLPNDPITQLEVLSFYVQIRRVITGLYKAILITGKDMLINEYKYTNLYRLYVQFIPALTNQYQYVEFEVKFRHRVGEPNHFEILFIFCFNNVTFFFSPPNKYKVFHGIAKHRFSASQKSR